MEEVCECPTTPVGKPTGLGSSAFARRYLRSLFEFFSSGYLDVSVHLVPAHYPMCSGRGDGVLPRRVSPFGYSRIIASVQLPVTFRRLHVLHRQLVPSHSPRTLCSLTIFVRALTRCVYLRAFHSTICNFQNALRSSRPSVSFDQRQRRTIPEGVLDVKALSEISARFCRSASGGPRLEPKSAPPRTLAGWGRSLFLLSGD